MGGKGSVKNSPEGQMRQETTGELLEGEGNSPGASSLGVSIGKDRQPPQHSRVLEP